MNGSKARDNTPQKMRYYREGLLSPEKSNNPITLATKGYQIANLHNCATAMLPINCSIMLATPLYTPPNWQPLYPSWTN